MISVSLSIKLKKCFIFNTVITLTYNLIVHRNEDDYKNFTVLMNEWYKRKEHVPAQLSHKHSGRSKPRFPWTQVGSPSYYKGLPTLDSIYSIRLLLSFLTGCRQSNSSLGDKIKEDITISGVGCITGMVAFNDSLAKTIRKSGQCRWMVGISFDIRRSLTVILLSIWLWNSVAE